MPWLCCLDLEGVSSISDTQAAHYIPGMRELQALNVSKTSVGLATLEAVTYGLRLRKWRREEEAQRRAVKAAEEEEASFPFWERQGRPPKRRRGGIAAEFSGASEVTEASPWPLSKIVLIRLQDTAMTSSAVEHLCVLENVQLVDVRGTNVKIPAVQPLIAHFNLTHQPNEKKLLARSNVGLIKTLQGHCGCEAMGWSLETNPVAVGALLVEKGKTEWVKDWEQRGIEQLLGEAATEERG